MLRKRTQLLILIVGLTVLATLAASLIYFNARPVEKRLTVELENVPPISDAAFRRTLESLMGNAVLEGNSIDLLKNGDLLAFAAAREKIRITTAFFYPDPLMEEALIAAKDRGVEIDILAPGEDIAEGWVRFASRNRWGNLLRNGIRIHEYDASKFHAKTVIIDDQWTSVGSANFDNRSFRINDETNVNVFSPDFAQLMIHEFNQDLNDSTEYDLHRWKNRSWTERARGAAGNLIGPHL